MMKVLITDEKFECKWDSPLECQTTTGMGNEMRIHKYGTTIRRRAYFIRSTMMTSHSSNDFFRTSKSAHGGFYDFESCCL